MIEVNEAEESGLDETVGQPFRYYVSESGAYLGATDGEPLSAFEVMDPPISSDQLWLFPGWGTSPFMLANAELAWRAAELALISRQLEAIEEDEADETPADLLPGTRKQWLGHRGRVTAWVATNPDFPDSSKRPIAPT
jgi:hypothetical protein